MNLAVNDKEREVNVRRGVFQKTKPLYVVYYLSEEREKYKNVLVDGETGKTLVFQKLSIDSAWYGKYPSVDDIYFDSISKVRQNYDKK